MQTVLVVDDTAIFREPITSALNLEGYNAIGVDSGRKALNVLEETKPDLILLDVAMPEMDGLTCLGILRANSRWQHIPVVLLTAIADRDCVMQGCMLGIKEYLVKSYFSLDQLLDIVARVFAEEVTRKEISPRPEAPTILESSPISVKHTVTAEAETETSDKRQLILAKLRHTSALKTLAGSVQTILSMTSSADTKANELVDILNRDAILASKILQVANSAAYLGSSKGTTANLQQAVLTIGFNTIRNVALSVGVFEALPARAFEDYDGIRCWEHCWAVGRIMDLMIPDSEAEVRGINHLIGLCHDLPELVIRSECAEEFTEISSFSEHSMLSFGELSELVLGVKFSELAHVILANLGLPNSIVNPIIDFFVKDVAGRSGGDKVSRAAHSLRIANLIAHGIFCGPSPSVRVQPLLTEECQRATGMTTPPEIDLDALRREMHSTTMALSGLNPTERFKLEQPLFAKRPLRVMYVRPGQYCNLDPLRFALEQLATVSMERKLPTIETLPTEIDALVIVKSPGESIDKLVDAVWTLESAFAKGINCLILHSENGTPQELPAGVQLEQLPISLHRLDDFLDTSSIESAEPIEVMTPS